jgi:class 3 adenylate cyclase
MVFGRYDRAAGSGAPPMPVHAEKTFAPGGKARLAARCQDLLEAGADPGLAARLRLLLDDGDDHELARMRPYALADMWKAGRRDVLEIFLLAARAGLLDFRWDLLCPSCRGAKATSAHMRDIKMPVHCDACHIDFRAAFDRSVEVTFAPNPAIRSRDEAEYCVGSPQRTPHVVCRHNLAPKSAVTFDLALDPGRYRLRSPSLPGAWHVRVSPEGEAHAHAEPPPDGWPRSEAAWNLRPRLSLANPTARGILFVLERMAWTDDAATAAEVTALQSFRDLFAEEALRPGEEISVGSLAFLFTDLRGSTRLYRDAGDAKAFGLVMEHFDILKSAIAAEGGAVVKTIGDAVLAVFPRPQSAVRAAMESHRRLAESQPSLVIKAGVHCGPCIAVNQNDRLDYFGSTLNLAARLLGFSSGGDVVVTREVGDDPETSAWLEAEAGSFLIENLDTPIRGFEKSAYSLLRLSRPSTADTKRILAGS